MIRRSIGKHNAILNSFNSLPTRNKFHPVIFSSSSSTAFAIRVSRINTCNNYYHSVPFIISNANHANNANAQHHMSPPYSHSSFTSYTKPLLFSSSSKKGKSIEEQYSRKTPLEHILLRPGMYVGPVEKSQPSLHWIPHPLPPIPTTKTPTEEEPWNWDNDALLSSSSSSSSLSSSSSPILQNIQMKQDKISHHPALIKVFDEILVNAFDNRLRQTSSSSSASSTSATTQIDVIIHPGDNNNNNSSSSKARKKKKQLPYISIRNNGKGIPIQIHKKEKMYLPEMLFGHLLTGSNFDDVSEKKLTGGRHGYGAKLTNIFSKYFVVETVDAVRKKKYVQCWEDNMKIKHDAIISDLKNENGNNGGSMDWKDYTKIAFVPDLQKLARINQHDDNDNDNNDDNYGNNIPMEDYSIMCRRVFDIAGCSGGKVRVTLNGQLLPISNFQDYAHLFQSRPKRKSEEKKNSKPLYFQRLNARWEVGVGLASNSNSNSSSFESMSFVNGMDTIRGGTHVNAIVQQITKRIANKIVKDYPELAETVTQSMVKRHLCIFVNALIENPSFDSQMKEHLNTSPTAFGSRYTLSEKFLASLLQGEEAGGPGIVEDVVRTAMGRQQASLINLVGGKKKSRRLLLNIPKLDDAHKAGSESSSECTLILTEGDSAKALAVTGLEVIGREMFGVFPLRGKFLNVRDASVAQLTNNKEVKALCTILGLDFEKTYDTMTERSQLRYGYIMLMTDQDADGSHIKGLMINFFRHFWPQLLKPALDEPDGKPFLSAFVTPLLKATKKGGKKQQETFFSISEYNAWRSNLLDDEMKKWKIKYYKGLGTSTQAEAKEYFTAFLHHHRPFKWNSDEDGKLVDMVFEKSRAEDRKDWLRGYDETAVLDDPSIDASVTYEDFINKELIHFSNADNMRSLPSIVDGLKPSQRKVLYACFKRNLKNEIKVAQLTGYCAEHTVYHHGEASLHATITGMAQDFVGSNNINLLEPRGQFGTRLAGGKDAASPRYIFTCLSPIARLLFPEVDDPQLNYLEDDGVVIEPKFFCPILPLLLINGVQGIGTGWSSNIPSHNALDLLDHVRARLNEQDILPVIRPWVRGFKGILEIKDDKTGYRSVGIVKAKSKTSVEISELPVGKWTNDYKEFLLKMQRNGDIESFVENHTTTTISFTVYMKSVQLSRMKKSGLEKVFKLDSNMSINNMHAFDHNSNIQKFTAPENIVDAYFPVRMQLYHDRKSVLECSKEYETSLIRNKAKFIEHVVDGKIDLIKGGTTKDNTVLQLADQEFMPIYELQKIMSRNEHVNSNPLTFFEMDSDMKSKQFDYLLNMPLSSLTADKVESLVTEAEKTEQELNGIKKATPQLLWLSDLEKLETTLRKMKYR